MFIICILQSNTSSLVLLSNIQTSNIYTVMSPVVWQLSTMIYCSMHPETCALFAYVAPPKSSINQENNQTKIKKHNNNTKKKQTFLQKFLYVFLQVKFLLIFLVLKTFGSILQSPFIETFNTSLFNLFIWMFTTTLGSIFLLFFQLILFYSK
jgi:hypothetical protein